MAQQFADDGKAEARPSAERRECVPKIMQANVIELGTTTNGLPGAL